MRFVFGADDSNATTAAVLECLRRHGDVAVVDDRDQWPDIGREVGRRVASGEADLGVVMCWTGTGITMAANKVPGVRAALAWDAWVATGARRWNDANVLGLSLKRLVTGRRRGVPGGLPRSGQCARPGPEGEHRLARLTGFCPRPRLNLGVKAGSNARTTRRTP